MPCLQSNRPSLLLATETLVSHKISSPSPVPNLSIALPLYPFASTNSFANMQFTLAILALAAIVKASPFPQAVTSAISPTDSAPPGCSPTFSGSFGIAVMNVSSSSMAKRQVTQLSEYVVRRSQVESVIPNRPLSSGQPLAASVTAAPVSQISDAQPQAPTAMMMAPVSMITDGMSLPPFHAPNKSDMPNRADPGWHAHHDDDASQPDHGRATPSCHHDCRLSNQRWPSSSYDRRTSHCHV